MTKRVLLVFLAWAGSAVFFAPICFVLVIVLAGPHSALLPRVVQPVVLVLGWAVLLIVPILVARAVWRRQGGR